MQGRCCVEGDLGAPLEMMNWKPCTRFRDAINHTLTKEGLKAIEEQGALYFRWRWRLFNTNHWRKGVCLCFVWWERVWNAALNKLYFDGKWDFETHLLPSLSHPNHQKKNLEAVYHKWKICAPACSYGKSLQVPLYKFLKTRSFGIWRGLVQWFGESYRIYRMLIKVKSMLKTDVFTGILN